MKKQSRIRISKSKSRRALCVTLALMLALAGVLTGCGGKETAEEQEQTQATFEEEQTQAQADYTFRYDDLLESHYEKHGIEMGFASPEEYLAAANAVIANPDALTKTEAEDGDMVYYVEETNEFVVVSTDGYIRTYFCPDSGKRYFDKQ